MEDEEQSHYFAMMGHLQLCKDYSFALPCMMAIFSFFAIASLDWKSFLTRPTLRSYPSSRKPGVISKGRRRASSLYIIPRIARKCRSRVPASHWCLREAAQILAFVDFAGDLLEERGLGLLPIRRTSTFRATILVECRCTHKKICRRMPESSNTASCQCVMFGYMRTEICSGPTLVARSYNVFSSGTCFPQ